MKSKRISKLTDEAQEFVVCALACFETPSMVAQRLKREFGVSITPQSIQAYDPTKRAGARLSLRWRQLFEVTRAGFVRETAGIGIAHKAVRLHRLQRMADAAESKKHYALAASLLEQAAREVGNAFTNHRVVSGPAGGPVQVHQITSDMSVQDAAAAWSLVMEEGP